MNIQTPPGGSSRRAATTLDAAEASIQTTASPRLRVILSILCLVSLTPLYLCRHWHWQNILCMAGLIYSLSFATLCLISWLVPRGGSSRRAATTLPASDAGTPSTLNPQLSTSPRPSPAVARVIYINLLNTTKHRL